MNQVQNIQKSYASVQTQFGQLKLAQIRLDAQEVDLEEALKIYRRISYFNQKSSEAYMGIGRIQLAQKDFLGEDRPPTMEGQTDFLGKYCRRCFYAL